MKFKSCINSFFLGGILLSLLFFNLSCFPSFFLPDDALYDTAEATLANKIPVIYRYLDHETTQLNFFFVGGHSSQFPHEKGINQLALKYAMQAGYPFKSKQVQEKFAEYGASLSCQTESDFAYCQLTAPSKTFFKSFIVFRSLILYPTFPKEDLAEIKQQVIKELEEHINHNALRIPYIVDNLFFSDHPYLLSPRTVIENIKSLSKYELTNHYRRLMNARRIVISYAGNHRFPKVMKVLKISFDNIARNWFTALKLPKLTPETEFAISSSDEFDKMTYIMGKYQAPPLASTEYWTMNIVTRFLNEQTKNIPYFNDPTTFSHFKIGEYKKNYGSLMTVLQSSIDPLKQLKNLIKEIKTNPLPEAKLTELKQSLLQNQNKQLESPSIAYTLGKWFIASGSWQSYFSLKESLEKISQPQVQQVAETYLKGYSFGVIPGPLSE